MGNSLLWFLVLHLLVATHWVPFLQQMPTGSGGLRDCRTAIKVNSQESLCRRLLPQNSADRMPYKPLQLPPDVHVRRGFRSATTSLLDAQRHR